MPGAVLGAGDTAVNKTQKSLFSWNFPLVGEAENKPLIKLIVVIHSKKKKQGRGTLGCGEKLGQWKF